MISKHLRPQKKTQKVESLLPLGERVPVVACAKLAQQTWTPGRGLWSIESIDTLWFIMVYLYVCINVS
jgi:hypothetical protein